MMDIPDNRLIGRIQSAINDFCDSGTQNLDWLVKHLHPYFFITMKDEPEAIATMASGLQKLEENRRIIMADRDKMLILACLNRPGSLYDTMSSLQEREISYTEIIHSDAPPPGLSSDIEIHRYEFDRKTNQEIANAKRVTIPEIISDGVREALTMYYPSFDLDRLDRYLRILWLNNRNYVRISPARRIAQALWAYHQGNLKGGVYLGVEETADKDGEYRVLFSAGNPPQKDFLLQIMEVFHRLNIGISRTYCLTISNGVHPYFIGSFYTRSQDVEAVTKGAELYHQLRRELYNTQILGTGSKIYGDFVRGRVMSGEDASLVNAFIAFCHTNLAHNRPDTFDLEVVRTAFHTHPEMSMQMVKLFRSRFDPTPEPEERDRLYGKTLEETEEIVEGYSTGNRFLDESRRTIFRCCLAFISHTLKTNFFVLEKQALAFRVDPAYLSKLDPDFCADLPPQLPFRVTFFFARYGVGYHIGFSDIARGGWRTIIAKTRDEYVTNADTLFREVYVLAHTQHLKNKDIYEGGSKMAIVLDAEKLAEDLVTHRMYKLQFGFTNAFLDIFTTENSRVCDDRIVDYYGEDEPIELGPDENMHDAMIENIAHLSVRRGYVLGDGIISSKKNGINHKEYGVTSTGVVKFAEITMQALGIDIHRDPFTVNFTGGPDGDVAGNAIRLLLERCPKVKIKLIQDGSAALYDPGGADQKELARILFKGDIDTFDPDRLNPGGFVLYRSQRRTRGLRKLFKRTVRSKSGHKDQWVSMDDFHREYNRLIFSSPADLFIPAGGRPETVHLENWKKFFGKDGSPNIRAIVEGANSFITPDARVELQKGGIVIMRDASANKCGVISSSYEVIANLLMSEEEFISEKEQYVSDVLDILERRAEDEARLIFRRFSESGDTLLFTDISDAISLEINAYYTKLFALFQENPELRTHPLFQKAILTHLPDLLQKSRKYRARVKNLPDKYQSAILASETASSLIYRSNRETDMYDMVKGHLKRVFTQAKREEDPGS